MRDEYKTKEQLIDELEKMRRRVTELEASEDISMQKENDLKNAIAGCDDLHENLSDMFISVDPKTALIIQCNQTIATNLGYTKEEIVGQPVFDIYHPDCMEALIEVFESFARIGEARNIELQLKRKNGCKINVSLDVSAVRDEQGNILHRNSIWRNIVKTEIVEADRPAVVDEMVMAISHHINNPLTAIMLALELILKEKLPGRLHCYIMNISHNTKTIRDIIKKLNALKHIKTIDTGTGCQMIDINSSSKDRESSKWEESARYILNEV